MAKTTATVTVGADTSPFQKAMKGLSSSLTAERSIGGALGGGAMSALGSGLGFGAGLLGIKGFGSIMDLMKALSPELNGAIIKLKVAFADALVPAAESLAIALNSMMPAIKKILDIGGKSVKDAKEFWSQGGFDLKNSVQDFGDAVGVKFTDKEAQLIADQTQTGSTPARTIAAGIGFPGDRTVTATIDSLSMGYFLYMEQVISKASEFVEGGSSL